MKIERLAKSLGYAGLIPFLVFSTGTWIDLPGVENSHYVLITYAAVILSFMGAIHWGIAMGRPGGDAVWQLGLSVLPALFGWAALLLPVLYGYSILIVVFAVLCALDQRAAARGLVPSWYPALRVLLTTVVVLCLIGAALARLLTK